MREIDTKEIADAIAELSQEVCYTLGPREIAAIDAAIESEEAPLGKAVLKRLRENAEIASEGVYPLCQDTGTTVVFLDIGQDVHLAGGSLREAVNDGVRRGYADGFLRKSIVDDPVFDRSNTADNTPAVVHTRIVPGEGLRIRIAPKGGGCENVAKLAILTPAQGVDGVKKFVVESVLAAGPAACPPFVVGVGIGGDFELSAIRAKEALLRPLGEPNPDPRYAGLERQLLDEINASGVGPLGLGGRTTAFAVHVESAPTHITSIPVAVNIQCHSARHKEREL